MLQFDNIIAGNGISITLTGMSIVFSGLLLISLFIILLPRILNVLDRFSAPAAPKPTPATNKPATATEQEIMAAISLALHMELERCGGDLQRITMKRRPASGTFWTTAGKMRSLSNRSPYA